MEDPFVYVFLIGLISLGFMFPKAKWVHILLVFMSFSLYTMSYDDWDRLAYMNAYDNVSIGIESRFEYLFVLLMRVCSWLGLSFDTFRYVTAAISISGLEYASFKFSKYRNIVWAVYLIYPAWYDAVILRNSMAMGIIAVSLVKLVYAKTNRDYIRCSIWIVIATLIHKSSFVFLAFIPLWYYLKQGLNKSRFITILLFFIFIESTSAFLYDSLGRRLAGDSENYYDNLYRGNILFNSIMYLIYVSPVLLFWPDRVFKSCTNRTTIESNILKFNLLFLFVLIPQFYIAYFSRLFKMLFFLNYIYLARCAEIPKWKVAAIFGVLLYTVLLLFLRLYFYPDMIPDTLMIHFRTNLLLDLLRF